MISARREVMVRKLTNKKKQTKKQKVVDKKSKTKSHPDKKSQTEVTDKQSHKDL